MEQMCYINTGGETDVGVYQADKPIRVRGKYELLKDLADERGTSMSQLAEEFMDVGMELFEDVGLSEIAEDRLEEAPDEWLSHDEL
ncbi:MAG: hypothetical protein ABEK50_06505 [bacterium]